VNIMIDEDDLRFPPAPIPYRLEPASIPHPAAAHSPSTPGDGHIDGSEGDSAHRERIFGLYRRFRVHSTTSQPYLWICHIRVHYRGKTYYGTGFLINIPGSNTGCVLTAGHNLWMETRSYVDSVEIKFPGRDLIVISKSSNITNRQRYFVSRQYEQNFHSNYDYGAIILPGYQQHGIGYTVLATNEELGNTAEPAELAGFPGDKPGMTIWATRGPLDSIDSGDPGSSEEPGSKSKRLFYTLDTFGGQSGSPVYLRYKGDWTVVAIHTHGFEESNSAIRLRVEMLREVMGWLEHPLRQVSLRVNECFVKIGTRAKEHFKNGSGEVKARFSYDPYTDLMFIPLESTPQGADVRRVKYAIASVKFGNTYLRMDGRRLFEDKKAMPGGGGQVNCQYSVGPLEMFHIPRDINKNMRNMRNIESVEFPGVFLRTDTQSVSATNPDGPPGSVNAQWTAGESERVQCLVHWQDSPGVGATSIAKQETVVHNELARREKDVARREGDVARRERDVARRERDVARRERDVARREEALIRRELARTNEEPTRKRARS